MAVLVNRAKMSTSTTGTGTITLGSAEDGYQTFADAGVSNGDVVQYVIEELSNFEIGTGTYTASGTTLTRTVQESSNSDNAISLAGDAVVFISVVASDLNILQNAGSTKVAATSSGATVTGNIVISGTVDGRDIATDGTKLDGIAAGANVGIGSLAADSSPQLGGDLDANGFDINIDSNDYLSFGGLLSITATSSGYSRITAGTHGNAFELKGDYLVFTSVTGNEDYLKCTYNGSVKLYYDNSAKFETTSTGITVTGDVNSTSDIRAKKNIETIEDALEKVSLLRGVTFDWDNDVEERATGVIAQDVEKVLPEAVRDNAETGFKSVAYGNMVGLLVEAIKEQQTQIDELKDKVKKLNG